MAKILDTPLQIKVGNVPIRSGSWDRFLEAEGIYVFDDGRICWTNEHRLLVRDQLLLRQLFRSHGLKYCCVFAHGGLMNEVPVAARKMVVSTVCQFAGVRP